MGSCHLASGLLPLRTKCPIRWNTVSPGFWSSLDIDHRETVQVVSFIHSRTSSRGVPHPHELPLSCSAVRPRHPLCVLNRHHNQRRCTTTPTRQGPSRTSTNATILPRSRESQNCSPPGGSSVSGRDLSFLSYPPHCNFPTFLLRFVSPLLIWLELTMRKTPQSSYR